jgi:hypothetical protein
MGAGVAMGAHRAAIAAEQAISSPLLEGVSIHGAQGVLVNITGGRSMSLMEVSEATQIIHDAAGDDANIIFGAVLDESMDEEIMVTVIATGFNNKPMLTGLSVDEKPAIPFVPAEEALGATKQKPSVVRMTAPMSVDEYEVRKKILAQTPQQREEEVAIPKVERINRGTLTEREEASSAFDRLSAGAFRASSIRLTPQNESAHVPSGPRDLKEYDTPAYLRRGINIPSIEEQEAISENEEPVAVEQTTYSSGGGGSRERDDRPTFLRKIMD